MRLAELSVVLLAVALTHASGESATPLSLYVSGLAKEQRKCPDESLACPTSKPAVAKSAVHSPVDSGFVKNARWIQGASKHLVPKVKGSLHNVAGVVSTAMNSSYTLPSWGDGLREEAQIRIQRPRDVAQKAWEFGAPIGVQSYPRSDPFASETADGSLMLYYVAGDWLRRVDAKLGKVTTLLNLVEAAGMKSFSSAVVNGTCKCWPRTDSVHRYECGTPKQVEDGKHPKICRGGVPTNTVTNIMLSGVNYRDENRDGVRRSFLYVMLFEQKYGPVEIGSIPFSQWDHLNQAAFSWISDTPSKLLELDVSVVTETSKMKPKLLPLFSQGMPKVLEGSAHAASMAATYVKRTRKVHLFLAFTYPPPERPTTDPSKRKIDTHGRRAHQADFIIDGMESSIVSETITTRTWDDSIWCSLLSGGKITSTGNGLSHSYPCGSTHANGYCLADIAPSKTKHGLFTAKQDQFCLKTCNSVFQPTGCCRHYSKKVCPSSRPPCGVIKQVVAAAELRTTLSPPLLLWEIQPAKDTAVVSHHWQFEKGPLVNEPNGLKSLPSKEASPCGELAASVFHAKKWANVHLQTLKDGRGVLLSFTSLDTAKGCFKQNPDPRNPLSIITSEKSAVLGCTGMEVLHFDGRLHQTPVAMRKTRPLDSEPWKRLPLVGPSSTNMVYSHSNATVAFVTTSRGYLQAIDITKPIGASVATKPGAVLMPVAVAQLGGAGTRAKETAGFIAGGLEGEAPVIVAHENDAYVLTTFQRLWRFDAMQIVPCGNVLGFFQPAFAKWSVTHGKTSRKSSIAMLKAITAQPDAPATPWACELSKKVVKVKMGRQSSFIHKNIACCNPAQGHNGPKRCCVEKGADSKVKGKRANAIIRNALIAL